MNAMYLSNQIHGVFYVKRTLCSIKLLDAKGFKDSVVSINDDSVDVIIGATSITEEQRAQIEDIVTRKTERNVSDIVITTME